MTFNEVQKEVFEFIGRNERSLAAYLALAKKLPAAAETLPDYVRKTNVAFLSNFTLQGLPEVFKVQGIFHNLLVSTYLGPYNQHAQEILEQESELYKFKPQLVFLIIDSFGADKNETNNLARTLRERSGAAVVVGGPGLKGEFKFDAFLERIGREKYWNTKYKELGDLRLAPAAFPLLASALMGYAVAAAGVTKKCLVLDLDNTLWQGIVGEDGPDKILPNRELQEQILKLFKRGVILAINSRNNPEDALAVIEKNREMILRKEHFAAWRINWAPKSANTAALAEELNLGLDSFVFLDDSPFERAEVKEALPEVTVLSPEKLENYQGFFTLSLTDEDRRRGRMYAEERQRREFQVARQSLDDFLRELNLETTITSAAPETIDRVSQLTQRTNQFNLTTRRYSVSEIEKKLNQGWCVWTIQAQDRFGDYGIIGLAIVEPQAEKWRIDNFLMSCRILGRGIERALLTFVVNEARAAGAKRLVGEFIPSAKNKPAEPFYLSSGFNLVGSDESGHRYEYRLSEHSLDYPPFIKVTTQV